MQDPFSPLQVVTTYCTILQTCQTSTSELLLYYSTTTTTTTTTTITPTSNILVLLSVQNVAEYRHITISHWFNTK